MRELLRRLGERAAAVCLELLERHPGKLMGALSGFFIGAIVVLLGFWRTLIIALFVSAGFFIGKRRDEQKGFGQLLQMLFGERE